MSEREFTFIVNGLKRQCRYSKTAIDTIFLPLLKTLTAKQQQKNERLLVFLAAPPAVGKTTLTLLFEHLAANAPEVEPVQALSLDGFHYPQAYLKSHTIPTEAGFVPMTAVKGCPETYDLTKLKEKLQTLREGPAQWPIYDRTLHDISPETTPVTANIIFIEGNWLLLDELHWRDLKDMSDYAIFISAEENVLKPRLIERKILGGLSSGAAEKFYYTSDSKNVRRVLEHRLPADLELIMTESEDYQIKEDSYHGK